MKETAYIDILSNNGYRQHVLHGAPVIFPAISSILQYTFKNGYRQSVLYGSPGLLPRANRSSKNIYLLFDDLFPLIISSVIQTCAVQHRTSYKKKRSDDHKYEQIHFLKNLVLVGKTHAPQRATLLYYISISSYYHTILLSYEMNILLYHFIIL